MPHVLKCFLKSLNWQDRPLPTKLIWLPWRWKICHEMPLHLFLGIINQRSNLYSSLLHTIIQEYPPADTFTSLCWSHLPLLVIKTQVIFRNLLKTKISLKNGMKHIVHFSKELILLKNQGLKKDENNMP